MTDTSPRLHLTDASDASLNPHLLLVHGICGQGSLWYDIQDALLQCQFSSTALSLQGHEGEPTRDGPLWRLSLANYLKDLDRAWQMIGMDQLVLVGHSMGARICELWAQEHPERVAGLILVCPPGPRGPWRATLELIRHDPTTMAKILWRRDTGQYVATPKLCRRHFLTDAMSDHEVLAVWEALGPESLMAYLQMLFWNWPNSLPMRWQGTPVTIFGAEQDRVFHRWETEATAQEYGAEVTWLPGAHLSPLLEGSHQLASEINAWLRSSHFPPWA